MATSSRQTPARVGPAEEADGANSAAESRTADSPVSHRPTQRWLRRLLVLVVGLELGYLVLANGFLFSPMASGVLSQRPEKAVISYTRAYTWWPGGVFFRGLEISAENQVNQWFLSIDRGFGQFSLAFLPLKKVRASGIRAHGIDFRLRQQADSSDPPSATEVDFLPPIPGRTLPTSVPRSALVPREDIKRPWSFDLGVATAESLHQIWVSEGRITGELSLNGHTAFRLRKERFELDSLEVHLEDGRLEVRGQPVASPISLQVAGRLGPFVPRDEPGRSFLRFLDATLMLATEVQSIPIFRPLTAGVPGLAVDGIGRLDARLESQRGRLVAPSTLRLEGSPEVSLVSFRGTGLGSVVVEVAASEPGLEETAIRLRIAKYEVFEKSRGGAGQTAVLRGPVDSDRELTLNLTAPVFDLAASQAPEVELDAVLPASEVVNLGPLVRGLPSISGLRLAAGRGRVEGRLHSDQGSRSGTGQLELELNALDGRYRNERLRGDLQASIEIADIDLRGRRGRLAPSTIRVSNLVVGEDPKTAEPRERGQIQEKSQEKSQEKRKKRKARETVEVRGEASKGTGSKDDESWDAEFRVLNGCVDLNREIWLDTQAAVTMTDAEPILALLSELKPSVHWVDRFLRLRGLSGHGRIHAAQDTWRLQQIALESAHTEMLTTLDLGAAEPQGVLFARWRKLSAAVETSGGERDWDFVRSRRWYLAREAELLRRRPMAGCLDGAR